MVMSFLSDKRTIIVERKGGLKIFDEIKDCKKERIVKYTEVEVVWEKKCTSSAVLYTDRNGLGKFQTTSRQV